VRYDKGTVDAAAVLLVVISLLVVITFVWDLRDPKARSRAQWAPLKRRGHDPAQRGVEGDDR
jgi:hypothetical protein